MAINERSMSVSRWKPAAVFLLAFAVLIPGVLWGKIHDDEVIYWEIARNIAHGLGPLSNADPHAPGLFFWHIPFPSYLSAPFLLIYDDLVVVRLVAAAFTAAGTVAVFRLSERWAGSRQAWVTAFLSLLSFFALRYGGRFYYDAFGYCLFWWAVYAYEQERPCVLGWLLPLTVMARELWLLPGLLLAALAFRRRERLPLLAGALVPVLLVLLWIHLEVGFPQFLARTAVFRGGAYVAAGAVQSPWQAGLRFSRAWVELLAAHGIASVGVGLALLFRTRTVPAYLLPAMLLAGATLSVTPGFVANGGFTQYPLMMTGFIAIYGAAGLVRLWAAILPRLPNLLPVAVLVACVGEVVVGSRLSSAGALYGSQGVYGFGIESDREIIALLRREVQAGERVAGVHGAFVPRARWFWVERHVGDLAQLKPDWVVTYSRWIDLKAPSGQVETWEIGPYSVIHFHNHDHIGDWLQPRPALLPGLAGGS